MRKISALAWILALLVVLCACKPDNIITQTDYQTDDQTEQSETEDDIEQPEQNQSQPTAQEQQSDTELTEGARYLKNKTKNDHIRPTADIDGMNIVNFKTPQLKSVQLSFFTSENSAFNAGSMSEKEWFDALEQEYGLKLKYTLRPDSTLYSSQLIALNAGHETDIISANVNDCAAALGLMLSAEDIVTLTDRAPVSSKVFSLTQNRLFTAKGCSNVMWYNKLITGENDPFELYNKNEWTVENLNVIYNGIDKKSTSLLDCENWLAFGSAGTMQASGITDAGYTMALTDQQVIDTFKAFGDVFGKENAVSDGDFSFDGGNTVFMYGDIPQKGEFELGWAPIPKFTESGTYTADFCGSGMGISKTIADEKKEASVAFIVLWCARYSESRSDRLIYEAGLSPTEADRYLTFCEAEGRMLSADAQISELFVSQTMPAELYGTPDSVYNVYSAAYRRTDFINDRYQ